MSDEYCRLVMLFCDAMGWRIADPANKKNFGAE
jgi:hypothetical protein